MAAPLPLPARPAGSAPPPPEERFLTQAGADHGWIKVMNENNRGKKESIPYGILVMWKGIVKGREYFTILEGPLKGMEASVSAFSGTATQSRFTKTGLKHYPGARIKFDVVKQAIWFDGNGPFNAFSGGGFKGTLPDKRVIGYTSIPPGKYYLRIPDYQHVLQNTGRPYSRWSRYYETWFATTAIGNDGTFSRYLHPGELSDGCVTVRAFVYDPKNPNTDEFRDLQVKEKNLPGFMGLPYPKILHPVIGWDQVYDYLVLRRETKYGQYVGMLEVV